MLRDSLDSSGVRMTYLKGSLEIMRPSRAREVDKKQIHVHDTSRHFHMPPS